MKRFCCVLILLGGLCGCAGDQQSTNGADPAIPKAPPLARSASTSAAKSPDEFRVKFTTSKGDFVVEVHRDWSPNGADRFYELVQAKFYDECKFFRAISGFMVQFGINGDPEVSAKWRERTIPDDPVKKSNLPGFVTFAKGGPNSRTTQIFINYGNNARLDGDGFPAFGQIVEGMDVVQSLHQGYGDEPSKFQPQIQEQGNKFLESQFPKLDAIKTARLVDEDSK